MSYRSRVDRGLIPQEVIDIVEAAVELMQWMPESRQYEEAYVRLDKAVEAYEEEQG